jgi:predicted extracellular nuclease
MALTPENIAINEIDSDTPGTDTAEFVELYDGGVGNTDLSGLVVVFYNGSNDQSYAAFDLDGYNSDANGYFVLGNAGVPGVDLLFPGNTLQNGADAVALYTANASDFPNNTPITTTNLIDAIAYDTNDADDSDLLVLLNQSEPQVDENNGANGSANDSLQRVPNSAGGGRNTNSYQALTPTPSAANTILNVEATLTKIHDIQGSAATFNSAFGGTRTIEGIVVAAFTGSSKLNGFYVQEEDADADTDSKTSEAIFVFDPLGLFSGSVGDKVKVSGTVSEFNSSSSGITSSLTQLSSLTSVVNLGVSNLPTVTNIQLPVTSVTDLERYEGMLVNVSAATGDLTVTEQFQLGRFGQVVLSATGTSNQPGTDGRLDQYTQFNAPSVSGYSAYLNEIAKRRIILDDGSNTQNPDPIINARGGNPLSASNTLRGGDTVANISGVLDQRFEGYRVQTSTGEDFTPANPRPNTPPNVGGTLKVASFNILNYFNGDGLGGGFPTPRGAENLTEFNRQRDKIIQAIIGSGADALGLIELENDGYGANSAIQNLVNGLNGVAGTGTYTFINPETSLGTDQIAVGIIYKAGKVTPVGAAATTPDGYGQGAFDATGRKPLAQTFQIQRFGYTRRW